MKLSLNYHLKKKKCKDLYNFIVSISHNDSLYTVQSIQWSCLNGMSKIILEKKTILQNTRIDQSTDTSDNFKLQTLPI